jgi:hypothetical protein
MNVVQIINAASASEVCRLYAQHWIEDEWAKIITFRRFKAMLNAAVGVQGNMRAVVAELTEDLDERGFVRHDVSGDDGSGRNWSLGFTSWAEWKLMEVDDRSGVGLSIEMLAMSLYYEMSWHGWPEEMIERRDHVFDLALATGRNEKHRPAQQLP